MVVQARLAAMEGESPSPKVEAEQAVAAAVPKSRPARVAMPQPRQQTALDRLAAENEQQRRQAAAGQAGGRRQILVSLADQRLYALQNGLVIMDFVCSTGSTGIVVHPGEPDLKDIIHDHVGHFEVQYKDRDKFSKTYNTPMHFALHYTGGHFIHATVEVEKLGRPASHGCVRLHPEDAEKLFDWVRVGDEIIIQEEPFSGVAP